MNFHSVVCSSGVVVVLILIIPSVSEFKVQKSVFHFFTSKIRQNEEVGDGGGPITIFPRVHDTRHRSQ